MRKFGDRRYSSKGKYLCFTALILIIGIVISMAIKLTVGPNMDLVSEIKGRGVITELINQTIEKGFSYDANQSENSLINIQRDKDGNIKYLAANTKFINVLIAQFAQELQAKYDNVDSKRVKVPWGVLFGNKILSQSSKGITIKVLPICVTNYDYKSQFVSEGINQTKYNVYMNISSDVRIIAPFSHNTINVKHKILIAEAIIVGDVPENYIFVPENEILDATQQ